jgi:hypothetical protein
MNRLLLAALLLVMTCVSFLSWSNGGQSQRTGTVRYLSLRFASLLQEV